MRTESRNPVAFGKLPDGGDFVRYNAGGTAVSAVETWIDTGLRLASNVSSFEASYAAAPPVRFWFDAGPSSGILVGVIYPSRDRVGREYPFVLGHEVHPARYDIGQLPAVPVRWSAYLDAADRLAVEAAEGRLPFRDMSAPLRVLAGESSDGARIQDNYRAFLKKTTLKKLCERVWDDFDDPQKFLLFKNLIAIVSPLQAGVPARMRLALRFPLGVDAEAHAFDVGFWVDLCLQLLNAAEVRPSFFWTAPTVDGGGPPFLLLALRPPSARYFAYLFAGLRDDHLCILDQIGVESAAEAAQALPGPLCEGLTSRTVHLEQFVEDFTRFQRQR